jgi:hypothetical protein
LTGQSWTVERVHRQRNRKIHGSINGWVATRWFRLSLNILDRCWIWRNQTLNIELNEGLLHWKDSRRLKFSQT